MAKGISRRQWLWMAFALALFAFVWIPSLGPDSLGRTDRAVIFLSVVFSKEILMWCWSRFGPAADQPVDAS